MNARGGGCWTWKGALNNKGYGQFRLSRSHSVLAHRYAWEETNGPIPAGQMALHRCDNPRCVRPSHIFLGTQTDNMADARDKGRVRHGNRHASAVLTGDVVQAARRRYASGGVSIDALAREAKVSRQTMQEAIRGDTWRHVPGAVSAAQQSAKR